MKRLTKWTLTVSVTFAVPVLSAPAAFAEEGPSQFECYKTKSLGLCCTPAIQTTYCNDGQGGQGEYCETLVVECEFYSTVRTARRGKESKKDFWCHVTETRRKCEVPSEDGQPEVCVDEEPCEYDVLGTREAGHDCNIITALPEAIEQEQ